MLFPHDGTVITNASRVTYEASNYSDLERAMSHLERNVFLIKGVVRRTLLGQPSQGSQSRRAVARIRTSTIDPLQGAKRSLSRLRLK